MAFFAGLFIICAKQCCAQLTKLYKATYKQNILLRRQHDLKNCATVVTVRHYPANITSCYKYFVVSIGQPHNIIIIILLHNAHVHLYGACACVCVCACVRARVCVCVCVCPQASIHKTMQWPHITHSCLPSKAHLKNTVGDRTINSKEGCTSHMM